MLYLFLSELAVRAVDDMVRSVPLDGDVEAAFYRAGYRNSVCAVDGRVVFV